MIAEKAALGTDRPGRALNLTDLTASVHWYNVLYFSRFVCAVQVKRITLELTRYIL